MTANAQVKKWLDEGFIVMVDCDYMVEDGRILRRGFHKMTQVWVDVENGVWYKTLCGAVRDDSYERRPVDRKISC